MEQAQLDQLCIDTLRTLSIDAVQQAQSGHLGTDGRRANRLLFVAALS
jgi:transketolase